MSSNDDRRSRLMAMDDTRPSSSSRPSLDIYSKETVASVCLA